MYVIVVHHADSTLNLFIGLKLNDSSVAPTNFAHFSHISDDLPRDVPYLLFYVRDDVPRTFHCRYYHPCVFPGFSTIHC